MVGILVSGLVGPTVAAAWTGKRDRDGDHRAVVGSRREDLRGVLDEAARSLASAIPNVKKLMAAGAEGEPMPEGPRDLLAELMPLSQRIQLRLPTDHPVVAAFEGAREALVALSKADGSQEDFDHAVEAFETKRSAFLGACRDALQKKITRKVDI
jgi:hypothetical protein